MLRVAAQNISGPIQESQGIQGNRLIDDPERFDSEWKEVVVSQQHMKKPNLN
jgi:hypothetical protein